MFMVSGVIARWINLVPVVWMLNPNKVELMLHVEHTESIPFSLPMSYAALHTIHPAHLPLISFPTFTTVECVVMDMGSIHSSSVEYVSFAILTLMLLPLTTVLETTGSMVHMVAMALGVFHLVNGMNFLSRPSTTGLNPMALLKAPTNVAVNESSDGTPLCLNSVDRASLALKGGNSLTAWVANVCTSSFILINLSLSCSACSVALLTLGARVSSELKFHVEYIVPVAISPTCTSPPVRRQLVSASRAGIILFIIMSTTVVGTDIRTIGVRVKWFTDTISEALENGDLSGFVCRDALVIADMIKMMEMSRSCDHTATRRRNMYGYERTPKDFSEIPTTVEQMSANFVGLMNANGSMRVNGTISAILCDIMCLIDIAMMNKELLKDGLDIVCINMTSGRHAGMTKLIFSMLQKVVFKHRKVFIHMFVTREVYSVMTTILNDDSNVVIHTSTDWTVDINTVKRNNRGRKIIVMMNNPMTPQDAMHLIETSNTMISTVVHMNNPMISHALSDVIRTKDMIMEMALLSDPGSSTVRVRNAIWDQKSNRHITMYRQPVEYTTSMIASLTYRIRPMNLKQMCYDCRMVHMLMIPVMHTLRDRNMMAQAGEISHWSESFASPITIDETEYEAPI